MSYTTGVVLPMQYAGVYAEHTWTVDNHALMTSQGAHGGRGAPVPVRGGHGRRVLRLSDDDEIGQRLLEDDVGLVPDAGGTRFAPILVFHHDLRLVAAWFDDDRATVKRFHRSAGGEVSLLPSNPAFAPIAVPDPSALRIHGKVVGIAVGVGESRG